MREYLVQYVNLLFAGAPDSDEIRQEILQNTLDRYDDLITQGKTPEAAYQLAISGIGDLGGILGTSSARSFENQPTPVAVPQSRSFALRRTLLAIAIGLYILCPIPLLTDQGVDGLCGLLAMVAVATASIMIAGKSTGHSADAKKTYTPQKRFHRSIHSLISSITLVAYFILSFATNAWHITWLIFPLAACVKGLIRACIDLREATNHEI